MKIDSWILYDIFYNQNIILCVAMKINTVYFFLSTSHVLLLFFLTDINGSLLELCAQMDYFSKDWYFHCLKYDDYGCWCGPGGKWNASRW